MNLLALCVTLLCARVLAADDVCRTGTCLANGDTVCDRAAGNCPPCMYAISGGYSCYGKVGNACPYPDTLTICPDSVPVVTTRAPSIIVTRAPVPAPAPAPAPATAAPATAAPTTATPTVVPVATAAAVADPVTQTPTVTEATPEATTPAPADKKTSSTNPETSEVGTVAPAKGTEPVTAPSSAPKATEMQNTATNSMTSSSKNSPKAVNIMIVVGAVVGVLVVLIFIVRRVRQRRNMPPMDMGFDDLGFDKTPQNRGSKEFSTAPTSMHYGDQNTYTNTQPLTNKIDYSTLEPEFVSNTTVRTKSRRQSRPSAAPSSVMGGQSELEFSIGVESSNEYPQHVDERSEQSAGSGRQRAKSRVRGIETSLIQNQYPELVGSYNSDVCSVIGSEQHTEEFDIVDPGAIRPGERSNTETLVADGRFGKFSMASVAESYTSDMTSSQSSVYSNSVYI